MKKCLIFVLFTIIETLQSIFLFNPHKNYNVQKRWKISGMQVNNCASNCHCFWICIVFPFERKEENPVKLRRHPRCFQAIPFQTGTSKQAHYWVGGYLSLAPLLHLADRVKLARDDLYLKGRGERTYASDQFTYV